MQFAKFLKKIFNIIYTSDLIHPFSEESKHIAFISLSAHFQKSPPYKCPHKCPHAMQTGIQVIVAGSTMQNNNNHGLIWLVSYTGLPRYWFDLNFQ